MTGWSIATLDDVVRKVRGLLDAFGIGKKIKIAYDERNLRGWYHFVFLLYANLLGDIVLDEWETESMYLQNGIKKTDAVVTYFSETGNYAIAAVNKDGEAESDITLCIDASGDVEISYISGADKDSYNDIDRTEIDVMSAKLGRYEKGMKITLKPHSLNVISIAEIGTRGSIR